MSRWTHRICAECFAKREPERHPTTILPAMRGRDSCCYCGFKTDAGIYYRSDPATTPCKGTGPGHADD